MLMVTSCEYFRGSLSEVYLHGMNLVTEGVKQIRGLANTQIEMQNWLW